MSLYHYIHLLKRIDAHIENSRIGDFIGGVVLALFVIFIVILGGLFQ